MPISTYSVSSEGRSALLAIKRERGGVPVVPEAADVKAAIDEVRVRLGRVARRGSSVDSSAEIARLKAAVQRLHGPNEGQQSSENRSSKLTASLTRLMREIQKLEAEPDPIRRAWMADLLRLELSGPGEPKPPYQPMRRLGLPWKGEAR